MTDMEMFFHCDNCGVLCRQNATYCSSCGKSFVKVENDGIKTDIDIELTDGVTYSEARAFIDKRPDRFIDVFQKNKGKKWFFSLNLPALFVAPYWLLYRKMYKNFFVYIGCYTAFSVIAALILYLFNLPTINDTFDLYQYLSEQLGTNDLNSIDVFALRGTDLLEDYYLFRDLSMKLVVTIKLWSFLLSFLFSICFSTICDCLYRNYVIEGVKKKSVGGVCWTWVLVYLAISVLYAVLT